MLKVLDGDVCCHKRLPDGIVAARQQWDCHLHVAVVHGCSVRADDTRRRGCCTTRQCGGTLDRPLSVQTERRVGALGRSDFQALHCAAARGITFAGVHSSWARRGPITCCSECCLLGPDTGQRRGGIAVHRCSDRLCSIANYAGTHPKSSGLGKSQRKVSAKVHD